ncbi:Proline/betaine transporter [Ferriphaselus amnicola]|uniref:Proline/betaine transporter n=1 Tax=Ferriphaselus amnicola TaxID=1188319 RepID=A0A2Z6GEX2_9PROT|nr:MFS transporter [Ferriphaselus amnicola]BBE52030.1 Proline/betaine transporter [Ferriphaselus amnicola]
MSETKIIQRKVAIAACFGTFLEWYDFLTFASLATYFSVLFFPPENPVAALLASLATFGVGMLVRPLGAALFGSLADKYGRRPIFIATLVLMGGATFGVGLLPTYHQVGMLAPALLLVLRLLQGFSVGGEIGGSAVYLTEHAPANQRGIYTSVLQLMGPLGILVSTFQILLLQAFLSGDDFNTWGWRVPFLFSAVLLLVSLKSRLNLHESPVFSRLRENKALSSAPLRECFADPKTRGRMALLFFCISAGGSLLFFSSQVYTSVFLKSVVRLDPQLVGTLVMSSTLLLFPLTILFGWLSDRIGRRPVLLAGLLLGSVTIFPVYTGLLHYGNPALERFNRDVSVELHGAACAYSPFTTARNDCERNQELLAKLGVTYTLQLASAPEETRVRVGQQAELTGFQSATLMAALKAEGWRELADTQQVNRTMIFLLLVILVVAVALITGPQTATLAELFPARMRYTAVALPHNLSAGWIGGMSPFMITLLSVQAGNAIAGLWYPVALLLLALVLGAIFLPETRNVSLDD